MPKRAQILKMINRSLLLISRSLPLIMMHLVWKFRFQSIEVASDRSSFENNATTATAQHRLKGLDVATDLRASQIQVGHLRELMKDSNIAMTICIHEVDPSHPC